MSKRKVVTAYSQDPIAIYKNARSPWSDVGLRFKAKPGKTVYQYLLTLVSKSDMAREATLMEDLVRQFPEDEFYQQELEYMQATREILGKIPIVVDMRNTGKNHYVYSSKEELDKPEAEKMISKFMESLGHSTIRCKWAKPSNNQWVKDSK